MTITVIEELSQAAEELIRRELARSSVRRAARGSGWSEDLWTTTASAGWFDALLGDEYGGLGLGVKAAASLFSLIGRHLVPGPYLDHMVMVPMVYPYAPAAVRSRLDRARAGDEVIVLADPEASGRTATEDNLLLERGSLSGHIGLVRYGSVADGFIVIARDSVQGVVAAFIDASSQGVTVLPRDSFDPASVVADVQFDHVQVPGDSMLKLAGDGAAAAAIERLRVILCLMIAAELAGLSRQLLDSSVDYAKVREQFGRPIGSFQPVQQILAEMAVQVLGLEAFTAECAGHQEPDPADALVLKGFASQVARQVGESALQVHGGMAFTEEFEGNRWFLRALTLQGLYGDDVTCFREIGHTLLEGAIGEATTMDCGR
jgi:alkylation response protein AidB-like acyl-CoA dehydrogenase